MVRPTKRSKRSPRIFNRGNPLCLLKNKGFTKGSFLMVLFRMLSPAGGGTLSGSSSEYEFGLAVI